MRGLARTLTEFKLLMPSALARSSAPRLVLLALVTSPPPKTVGHNRPSRHPKSSSTEYSYERRGPQAKNVK